MASGRRGDVPLKQRTGERNSPSPSCLGTFARSAASSRSNLGNSTVYGGDRQMLRCEASTVSPLKGKGPFLVSHNRLGARERGTPSECASGRLRWGELANPNEIRIPRPLRVPSPWPPADHKCRACLVSLTRTMQRETVALAWARTLPVNGDKRGLKPRLLV